MRVRFKINDIDELSDLPIQVYISYQRVLNSLSWIWKGEYQTEEMEDRTRDAMHDLWLKVRFNSIQRVHEFNYIGLQGWIIRDIEEKKKNQPRATD